jgi:hypothetical protein
MTHLPYLVGHYKSHTLKTEERHMSTLQVPVELPVKTEKQRGLSLDTWAVLAAFLAALLIRVGAIKHIPW